MTIRAAGGVVYRLDSDEARVAVIHRPHRGDWSLPKGKLHSKESSLVAAHREVVEETGLQVAVRQRLDRVRYRVDGTPKTVSYWAMRCVGGAFVANDEADELRWLSPTDARELLTFPADHAVLDGFVKAPRPDSVVLLIRHAKAGKRSTWRKDDYLRPLDAEGRRQAAAIAELVATFAPQRIYSARPDRCLQTVSPLGERTGMPIEATDAFDDVTFEHDEAPAMTRLRKLSRRSRVSVVCSQGGTIPPILDRLDPEHAPHQSRKGSVRALFFRAGELVASDYYERPTLRD